jgi:hypothetical protein
MADYFVAALQRRRRWPPSLSEPVFQNLIGGRMFVPNGNCRHSAESCRIVDQKNFPVRNNNVMRELILSYDFGDVLRMDFIFLFCRGPCKHLVEAHVPVDLF